MINAQKVTLGIMLCFIFLFGVLGCPATSQKPGINKVEYKVVEVPVQFNEDVLNKLVEEGWEFFGGFTVYYQMLQHGHAARMMKLIFKRYKIT